MTPTRRAPELSPDTLAPKNSFFARVYALTATIPPGKVMTYGQIAACLGGMCSAKIVGFAMRSAPSGLPCHRVVNKDGEAGRGGLFGGPERHREMLEAEGVPFAADGKINLAACLFQPEE